MKHDLEKQFSKSAGGKNMLDKFNFSLTFDEIIYAALGAFVLTWIIRTIIRFRAILKSSSSFLSYQSNDLKQILQRCYMLFPKDIVQFHGETYKRGMQLKITTLQNKIFEGEFIGCNEKDMLCILTKKYIIAHEINNIEDIQVIEKI